ncbi:hypothetical protein BS78_K171800 [Paspalum vaginatum]|uniref:Flowering-promoting factor 1-like protein 3 n=1 Tax=Paspalum vaginatum TaxID=158149 RepID=A0A9W7XBU2_9POAL|nr:hypothetical protein BS78_K171800 [Paspalum vaginatum]
MSGVWVFKDGSSAAWRTLAGTRSRRGAVAGGRCWCTSPAARWVTSYEVLERRLRELGWERYVDDPCLLLFHQRSTVHLISVPRDFVRFRLVHMYDIVVKTPATSSKCATPLAAS